MIRRGATAMFIQIKDSLQDIAADWLREATNPFPVFVLQQACFEMFETLDPRGGSLRILVPLDADQGTCHYLYRP